MTKTESLRQDIFRSILRGDYAPGGFLPPERDMAAQTGTSRITVRRAYAALEAAGILVRRQGSGTTVATHLQAATEPMREAALVTSVIEPFELAFLRALEAELSLRGILLVIRMTGEAPDREEQAAIDLVSHGVRNLIVWSGGTAFPRETFHRLRVLGVNTVFFDRVLPGDVADFVGLDNAAAMRDLFGHAVKRQPREAVFVTHEGLSADSNREREESLRALCTEANIPCTLHRVPFTGDRKAAFGRLRAFLTPDRADTAVFCVNDHLAVQARAILGADAAIYGVDGLPAAREAGIVTVEQPLPDMASALVECLINQSEAGSAWQARVRRFAGNLITPES